MLSIGSVVKLKNAEKLAMIIGFSMVDDRKEKVEIFDYVGCVYPQGVFNIEYNLFFNNSDIEKVVFQGYSNQDDKNFKEAHQEIRNEIELHLQKNNEKSDV